MLSHTIYQLFQFLFLKLLYLTDQYSMEIIVNELFIELCILQTTLLMQYGKNFLKLKYILYYHFT